ncbi:hypothetical protein LIER_43975 [Lithospermum erythrorhizon]|uniref:Uncharacterized protein n=1 Tax=Lithospermum erythrorhizon TaxID=34254 RepID=A0AAV3RFG2_LITER
MNLTLLAKQGWRIITKQASLLFRVLKGRWRIGDGRSIRHVKEPGVPRNTDFFLRGECGEGPRWVSQLI